MPRIKNPHLINIITDNMQRLRLAKGLRQDEVATRMGINVNQYCKYERGVNTLDLAAALRFCEVVGADGVQQLMDKAEDFGAKRQRAPNLRAKK